jgi:hypothetical protein
LCICPYVCTFTFSTSPEPLDTNYPRGGRFNFENSNEGECSSPRGDNSKRVKIHIDYLKIFSRPTHPNSIKLGTNYLWAKGIPSLFK